MPNPLFNVLGGNRQPQMNDGGLSQLMAQVREVQRTFKGDPRAEVQRLIDSGAMTQAQFNQLAQMANQILGIKQ